MNAGTGRLPDEATRKKMAGRAGPPEAPGRLPGGG